MIIITILVFTILIIVILQSFKEEISRCQNLIQVKDEEIKLKQLEVSNLLQEVEEKKRLMETLQNELEATKTDKKKVSDESSVIYNELNNKLADMEEKYKNLLEEKEKVCIIFPFNCKNNHSNLLCLVTFIYLKKKKKLIAVLLLIHISFCEKLN